MIAPFDAVLEPLARTKGVRAAVLAAEDDGVPVHVLAHEDVDADTLAALGCRLYRSARLASERAGFGASSVMHIEAEGGQVCVTRAGAPDSPLVLIVLAESDANIGSVRLVLMRAASEARDAA
ncbi:MAG: roadblock/LC7 domain-containing protein [Gemmatimonadaceae bacterium]